MSDSAVLATRETDISGDAGEPPRPTGRTWPWWSAAAAFVVGGLLTAAGGALRWWGPQRLASQTARENDDANPLHMGLTFHVHPGSGELVATGQMLVAVGLLLLVFLPWRGRAARAVAYPTLLISALGIAAAPAMWVMWWAQGKPTASFPGWRPELPDAVDQLFGFMATAWALGLMVLLLVFAVALVPHPRTLVGTMEEAWRRTPVAFVALLPAAMLFEMMICSAVFGMSHDDPVGTHVLSGTATVVAGALLARAAAARRHADVEGRAGARGLRWWRWAGVLFVLAGVSGVVSGWLYPPEQMMMSDAPYPPAVRVLGWVTTVLELGGYVLFVIGPLRARRRLLAAVTALVVLCAASVFVAFTSGLVAPQVQAEGLDRVVSLIDIPSRFGLLPMLLALVLAWEVTQTRPIRRAGLCLVVLAGSTSVLLASVPQALGAHEAPVPPMLGTLVMGLALWIAAHPPTDDAADSTTSPGVRVT